VSLAISVDIS